MTIALPDAGGRFMSMQVIDEDEYTPGEVTTARASTLSTGTVGTRYVLVGVRTLVDPNDPKDIVVGPHAAGCDQGRPARRPRALSRCPNWDAASQKKVREALLVARRALPDTKGMFGAKGSRSGSPPDRERRWPGAAIPRRTPSIST